MVRTYITEENLKINTFYSYRGKKIKFGNSESLGFRISPCAPSLEGEFPRNREFLCVIGDCARIFQGARIALHPSFLCATLDLKCAFFV